MKKQWCVELCIVVLILKEAAQIVCFPPCRTGGDLGLPEKKYLLSSFSVAKQVTSESQIAELPAALFSTVSFALQVK